MKGVRFEPLRAEHIAAVLAVEAQCQSSPWSERSFRNELDQKQSVFLVAVLGGEVVGYAGAWILADEAHITTLAVAPSHRRQGLGIQLMEEVLSRAVERDAICSTLEVRAGNEAALRLYEGMGYARCGLRKGYYPDNREDAVVMWLHDLAPFAP